MTKKILSLYLIDDGEQHWLVASSPDEALQIAREEFCVDEFMELSPADINRLDDNTEVSIWLTDGYHPSDRPHLPSEPTLENNDHWRCSARVKDWLSVSFHGQMLASSLF